MADVFLRAGRERSLLRRHPWVLSGSVERISGKPEAGALVRVAAADGRTLGFGHFSPESQIRVRMLAFGSQAPLENALEDRITRAVATRAADPFLAKTNACRLINAEGDQLPGLTVDRFDDVLVAKLTSAGMDARRAMIAKALQAATKAKGCIERADETAAKREGFTPQSGTLFGEAPAEHVWIRESGRKYAVDVTHGQKTGFYLDQRDARDLVESLSRGRSILDLYSHTGGFAVAAAIGGASKAVLVESSQEAITVAERNMKANAPELPSQFVKADVHKYLREEKESFGVVIVDPPPLAKARKEVDRAARAYKDAFLHAMKRVAADGYVLVFSCSHHVGRELLLQITFGAALDAGRSFQVLRPLGQPSDHPVSVDHPEGSYLNGLLLRAMES